MNENLLEKLLSHRFRGYAPVEHTKEGFLNAAKSAIKYFEIDTRASKDGVLYVFHDPYIEGHIFPETDSKVLDKIKIYKEETLPRLDDVLAIFKENFSSDTIFCLDVKDIGFEKEHIRLICKHGLEKQINIVSWCGKALMNFAEEGFWGPMFLSHQNLFSYGLKGRVSEYIALNKNKVKNFNVYSGKNVFQKVPKELYQGYFHSLRCRTLPENLLKILQKSGGGICVATKLFCKSLDEYCRKNSLKLWIYSVNEKNAFEKFASEEGIDIIFSDKAEQIYDALK